MSIVDILGDESIYFDAANVPITPNTSRTNQSATGKRLRSQDKVASVAKYFKPTSKTLCYSDEDLNREIQHSEGENNKENSENCEVHNEIEISDKSTLNLVKCDREERPHNFPSASRSSKFNLEHFTQYGASSTKSADIIETNSEVSEFNSDLDSDNRMNQSDLFKSFSAFMEFERQKAASLNQQGVSNASFRPPLGRRENFNPNSNRQLGSYEKNNERRETFHFEGNSRNSSYIDGGNERRNYNSNRLVNARQSTGTRGRFNNGYRRGGRTIDSRRGRDSGNSRGGGNPARIPVPPPVQNKIELDPILTGDKMKSYLSDTIITQQYMVYWVPKNYPVEYFNKDQSLMVQFYLHNKIIAFNASNPKDEHISHEDFPSINIAGGCALIVASSVNARDWLMSSWPKSEDESFEIYGMDCATLRQGETESNITNQAIRIWVRKEVAGNWRRMIDEIPSTTLTNQDIGLFAKSNRASRIEKIEYLSFECYLKNQQSSEKLYAVITDQRYKFAVQVDGQEEALYIQFVISTPKDLSDISREAYSKMCAEIELDMNPTRQYRNNVQNIMRTLGNFGNIYINTAPAEIAMNESDMPFRENPEKQGETSSGLHTQSTTMTSEEYELKVHKAA